MWDKALADIGTKREPSPAVTPTPTVTTTSP
jgi:hypothetical protein